MHLKLTVSLHSKVPRAHMAPVDGIVETPRTVTRRRDELNDKTSAMAMKPASSIKKSRTIKFSNQLFLLGECVIARSARFFARKHKRDKCECDMTECVKDGIKNNQHT